MRRIGHEHLHGGRADADRERRPEERRGTDGRRRSEQPREHGPQHAEDEGAFLEQVAEWDGMSTSATEGEVPPGTVPNAPPGWLVALLATASGLIAANLYYAQPLVGPIGASMGLSTVASGLS